MNLLKQNDIQMNKKIQKYGCRFRCLLAIVEFTKRRVFSAIDILSLYDEATKGRGNDIMNVNCMCGCEEHKICTMAFIKMGDKTQNARQIGSMRKGVPTSWAGNKTPYDYMIVHWETDTKDGHFTLFNNQGHEIYDPWNHNQSPMKLVVKQRELLYRVNKAAVLKNPYGKLMFGEDGELLLNTEMAYER